jgi:hypothetical protein
MEPSMRKTLAITSPTSGGRSVGIVRSRIQATEFVYCDEPSDFIESGELLSQMNDSQPHKNIWSVNGHRSHVCVQLEQSRTESTSGKWIATLHPGKQGKSCYEACDS